MFSVPLHVGGIRHRDIGGHGIDKAGCYNVGRGREVGKNRADKQGKKKDDGGRY